MNQLLIHKMGGGKQRLDYLDAARALAMIAVVYHHVMIFTLDLQFPIFSGDFVTIFMVPMFFFISGLMAYKPVEYWTPGYTGRKLVNKLKLLLIPTIVFYFLFRLIVPQNWGFPGGYWFTFSLFEMFVIYYFCNIVAKLFAPRFYTAILIVVSLLVLALTVITFGRPIFETLRLYDIRIYLPYFIMGVLAGRFKNFFEKLLKSDAAISSAVIFTVLACLAIFKYDALSLSANLYSLVYGLTRICLIVILFKIFKETSAYWQKTTVVPQTFRVIGRYTLEIYMIHYFFLWPVITPLKRLLTDYPNEMLIIPVTLLFTAFSIALSLLVCKMITTSHFLSKWLFAKG